MTKFTKQDEQWLQEHGFTQLINTPVVKDWPTYRPVHYVHQDAPYKIEVFKEGDIYIVTIGWLNDELFGRGEGNTLGTAMEQAKKTFKVTFKLIQSYVNQTLNLLKE